MKHRIPLLLLAAVCLTFIPACRSGNFVSILVLHAGSLSVPFHAMADAFMQENPGVEVRLEGYGSRTCARHITELDKKTDVFGSADSSVIRSLLIPTHADYAIDFATNEMTICYTGQSRKAGMININNWTDILLDPEVRYGHSDPDADPCGYRTRLAWKLAEIHYHREGLYRDLVTGMPRKSIRPKEVDLLALLETGQLDYIFIYRSVAMQHGLQYLPLPDEINLSRADMAEYYRQVSVKLTGKKPGETILRHGAPMVYGLTVPKTATRPRWALRFTAFVLSEKGRAIMKRNGQGVLSPPETRRPENLPAALRPFFE